MAPLVAAGLVLGACGGGSDEATKQTIVLDESAQTNYETLPIQTTTPTSVAAPVSSAPESGGAAASEYTIQSGDTSRTKVADRFGVSVEDLDAANAATDGYTAFYPGLKIIIPAGGTVPTEASGDTTDTVDPDATGSTIPVSGDNCAEGKYTIAAGDVPFAVAKKFDVSFDRLQAANTGIDFLKTFPVGSEIVIPASEDC
jgi:LysM repeat protein